MKKVTWNEVEKLCKDLAQGVECWRNIVNGVYGIPRGGLVPAVIFSHLTGIPLLNEPIDGCIIIDDINDTGATTHAYSILCPNSIRIVLYERDNSDTKAHIVGDVIDHNGWLVFPWEQVENATEDMADYLNRRHGVR